MRRVFKQIAALLTAVVLLCSSAGQAYASSIKGIDRAKSGIVSVQFWIKNPAFYAVVDGSYEKQAAYNNGNDTQWSSGTGFFVGKSGEDPMYIVTNHHVVADFINTGEGGNYIYRTNEYYTNKAGEKFQKVLGATSCELRVYYDDNTYDVAFVECYGDQDKVDLAVLKLRNATNKRTPLQLLVPTKDMVGETVHTAGFPGIADNMLTSASHYGIDDISVRTGTISKFVADDKGVERIQTDATIQHGNSGGPLITNDGYVVGVNTNFVSNSENEVNYYSIHSSELVKFLGQNNIPYELAKQGGGFPVVPVVIGAAAVAIAAAAFVVLSKKKAAVPAGAPAGRGAAPRGAAGQPQAVQPQAVQRAFIRSMAAQHNGMALVVNATPTLIGRDPGSCRLVYAEGTAGVSGQHCTIAYDAAAGEFILTDLRSTYGTFLMSGQRLNASVPYRLKPGSGFYVGDRANAISVELG